MRPARCGRRGPAGAGLALVALALAAAAPAPAAPVHLPARQRAVLHNGLTVVVVPTRRLPLVDLRLVARAGSAHDPPDRAGLASLTASLLTRGAGTRDARQIAEDIAYVGGTLEAGAGREQMVVTCEVLSRDLDMGLSLFHDVVVEPTFPQAELDRGKEEALGSIASDRDDPATVADDALGPFLMGTHPLAHPVVGTEEGLRAVTRDDVVAYHDRFLVPRNAELAIVGDVDPEAVIRQVRKVFGDWKPRGAAAAPGYPPLVLENARRVRIVSKPEVTQTQIRMACTGVARNHPDYYPIVVANTILGAGFASRLVDAVRVDRGLAYDIDSRFLMYRDAGAFVISTATRNETLRRTVDEVLKVVSRLRQEGPTPEELERAKRYLTGLFPLGLQAPDAIARQLVDVDFYGLDPDYVETYDARIDAVTMEDCRRALRSYFCVEDLDILVVGDPDTARPALEGLGPITVVPVE